LRSRLAEAGHERRFEDSVESRIVGCVFGNEVVDALPVHRVVQRGRDLRELMVSIEDDRFVELEREPSTPALGRRLEDEGVMLRDGQIAEVCLEVDEWIAQAVKLLERGLLLLIDYGHPAKDLYGPRRMAGSLLAYVGQRAHDDPFINVGRQDLTAHVDVTAVAAAAVGAGLTRIGVVTQAEFLVGLGLGDLLSEAQADPSSTLESYLELRSSVARMIDPAAMGSFRVMAFGRGLPDGVRLRGFEFRLPQTRGAAPAP
jgi:SAM-dependent MidA family methyltransferase